MVYPIVLIFARNSICKRPLFASHISNLRFETIFSPASKTFSVLCGEDFHRLSLDIHATLFKKRMEKTGVSRRKMSI